MSSGYDGVHERYDAGAKLHLIDRYYPWGDGWFVPETVRILFRRGFGGATEFRVVAQSGSMLYTSRWCPTARNAIEIARTESRKWIKGGGR